MKNVLLTLVLLGLLLIPIKSFAEANSGFTINAGVGITTVPNAPAKSENADAYMGSGGFLSFNALIGYQYQVSTPWVVGVESGIMLSDAGVVDAISDGIVYGLTAGTYLDDMDESKYSIPLLATAKYYLDNSGFNIFGKLGISYNNFKVTAKEKEYDGNHHLIRESSYKRVYKSIAPLVSAGVGYEFHSGIGLSVDSTYSFGTTANKAKTSKNLSNYSFMLNLSYLIKA